MGNSGVREDGRVGGPCDENRGGKIGGNGGGDSNGGGGGIESEERDGSERSCCT